MARTALVAGATGLVGGHLLRLLLDDPAYDKVTALVRRALDVTHPKLTCAAIDFDRAGDYAAHARADDVFSCLGTTIKKAGSQEAFRKVDFEYPLALARAASAAGAGQYLIVTAVGADAKSGVFYNRVKGEVEAALRAHAFPRGLKIFHPSVLLGERGESRPGERVAAALMSATRGLFVGALQRYRAIDAEGVARAMRNGARLDASGVEIYEGARLFELAAR
ncbi:MAG TPA: NAD(P)H-binding protein [Polyangia bacterium]|nr:NAD(P)H-binding protein [Polyangia bacterium]